MIIDSNSGILKEYIEKHKYSKKLYEEAKLHFPSGVTHDVRYFEPFPIYVTHAQGARKWDVDGNEYIDYVMGHGALILGHSHPEIVKTVKSQIEKGTHLGACNEIEIEWAKIIKKLMPSNEIIRFTSSGTEATLMALKLARAYTGKELIVKFVNHFHGWNDYLLPEEGKYSSSGIPYTVLDSVLKLDPQDFDEIKRTFNTNKNIAGIILEPTGGSMGLYPLSPDFLKELKELCDKYGVVLIFDEVVTGFRVSKGGAQERFGVRPHLSALGKIVGGGLPCGAVGGKREIMNLIEFTDNKEWNTGIRIGHPGTFNANPLSGSAGKRCLEIIYNEDINYRADKSAEKLREGINRILKSHRIKGTAFNVSSIVFLLFGIEINEDSIYNIPHSRIKKAAKDDILKIFKMAMLNNGVDMMGFYEFILSCMHGENEIAQTLEAVEKSIIQMKREAFLENFKKR